MNNKVIIFIVTRYLSYFIQFLNSLLIAYFLGPYYLGIWGFLTLILQYLAFGNFGIDNALNVNLSSGDIFDTKKQSEIIANALVATFLASSILVITAVGAFAINPHLFEKYLFPRYVVFIIIIASLNYFNVLFVNIFRAHSKFTAISIFQLLIQLVQLPVCFFLDDLNLVLGLLLAMSFAHLISLIIFIKSLPFKLTLKVDSKIFIDLYKRGIPLLFYNITFYLLMLSTKSMVGYHYPVETLGIFTFSSNIATALIVGLSSLEFVVFPKMLNRLSSQSITDSSITTFQEVRYIFMTTVYLVIILGLLCYPTVLIFFKSFQNSVNVFSYLVICQLILSSGFGYSTLIIARGKEMFLVLHGLIALFINLTLCEVGYFFFKMDYSYMALFLVLSFSYYDLQVIRKGRELLRCQSNKYSVLFDLIPKRSILAFILILCSLTSEHYILFYSLALISLLILHFKDFNLIKKYAIDLLRKPSIVNISGDTEAH